MWSGRWESNPSSPAWKDGARPLHHARSTLARRRNLTEGEFNPSMQLHRRSTRPHRMSSTRFCVPPGKADTVTSLPEGKTVRGLGLHLFPGREDSTGRFRVSWHFSQSSAVYRRARCSQCQPLWRASGSCTLASETVVGLSPTRTGRSGRT